MMGASLGGVPFDLNPETLKWDYTIHMTDAAYVGGKVIQVFGATMGDITLTGHFRDGSWEDQLDMLTRMKDIGSRQVDDAVTGRNSWPMTFLWPEQDWSFRVYLKEFSSAEGGKAIHYRHDIFNPSWKLVLFPIQTVGADSIRAIKGQAMTAAIERLSAGLGWEINEYNGFFTYEELSNELASQGFNTGADYLTAGFGIGGLPPIGAEFGQIPVGTLPTDGTALTVDQVLAIAYNAGFRDDDLVTAVAVAYGESRWNPNATNKDEGARPGDGVGTGDYSIGLWQINMRQAGSDGLAYGTEQDLLIPSRNAAAAFAIYTWAAEHHDKGRWGPWSVYTREDEGYHSAIPVVRAAYEAGRWRSGT